MGRSMIEGTGCLQTSRSNPCSLNTAITEILDSVPTSSAILDHNGVICLTNQAWRDFGQVHEMEDADCLGVDYIEIAESARGYSSEKAREVSAGIRSVLEGRTVEFVLEYPCHYGRSERWFRIRVSPLKALGPIRIFVTHENLSHIGTSPSRLGPIRKEFGILRDNLFTINSALEKLLEQKENEDRAVEDQVLTNIREQVRPYLEKLKKTSLTPEQREHLAVIEANLHCVTSPFMYRLSSKSLNLTSQEINVANLVLEGNATKEIAALLGISTNAVEFHRKNIRKKLGINSKKTSLRSRLLSLEPSCMYQQFPRKSQFHNYDD